MIANPGWPGEMRMRGVAEGRIDPNNGEPSRVLAYFDRFPADQRDRLRAAGRGAAGHGPQCRGEGRGPHCVGVKGALARR